MKLKRLSVLSILLLLPAVLFGGTAFFQDISLSLNGYYRVRHYNLWDINANSDDSTNLAYFTHQLRIKPTIDVNENVSLKLDIMGFNTVFGNNEGTLLSMSTADNYANIIVKRAYAEIMLPVGMLMVGRMPSHFGLGIMSNDGDHPVEFGDTDEGNFGNTYDRILFATKPLGKESPLLVGVFLDKVVSGQKLPLWEEGLSTDFGKSSMDVNEYGAVLKYSAEPIKTGLYFLVRTQSATNTELLIPDFCFSYKKGIFHTQLEVAYISGHTSAFPVMLNTMYITKPKVDVDSLGSVLRVGASVKPLEDLSLEIGYASGDKPGKEAFSDLKYSQFSFDPNYKVGLLMFDYVERYFSALKAKELSNYLKSNEATLKAIQKNNGLSESLVDEYIGLVENLTPTNGSVRNAFYIFPVIKYRPIDSLQLKLGVLGAWVAGKDYKIETRRIVATNGSSVEYGLGGNYGWEIDFGVKFQYTKNASIGLQAGYLLPGNIFEKANGDKADSVYTVIPRLTIMF